jgi:hypothetical protein
MDQQDVIISGWRWFLEIPGRDHSQLDETFLDQPELDGRQDVWPQIDFVPWGIENFHPSPSVSMR